MLVFVALFLGYVLLSMAGLICFAYVAISQLPFSIIMPGEIVITPLPLPETTVTRI